MPTIVPPAFPASNSVREQVRVAQMEGELRSWFPAYRASPPFSPSQLLLALAAHRQRSKFILDFLSGANSSPICFKQRHAKMVYRRPKKFGAYRNGGAPGRGGGGMPSQHRMNAPRSAAAITARGINQGRRSLSAWMRAFMPALRCRKRGTLPKDCFPNCSAPPTP